MHLPGNVRAIPVTLISFTNDLDNQMMKSKNYNIALWYLIILLCLPALTSCKQDIQSELPAFDLQPADGSSILNTGNLPQGTISMFIHFDSACKSCQEETRDLLHQMTELEDVTIFFISVENLKQLRVFRDHFKLKKYPNIMVARDTAFFFPRHFQSGITPMLALYDRQHKLRAVFKGKADMKKLLTIIEEIR